MSPKKKAKASRNRSLVRVDLRIPRDLFDDLRNRVKGTPIPFEHYVAALLAVQVVDMIKRGREEDARWQEYVQRKDAEKATPPADEVIAP